MHRSGTSAISRIINFLGVYLGKPDELYGQRYDNLEGFWERKDIVDFHDELLRLICLRWDTSLPLSEKWMLSEPIAENRKRLKEIIDNAFCNQKTWAWKDPRTCITLPLWKELLAELNIHLSVVLIIRNPADVAISLAKRNGFSFDKSYGIWLNYNLSALKVLSDQQPLIISYDHLLDTPQQQLSRLSEQLSIPFPSEDENDSSELIGLLRHDLRHSYSAIDDLREAPQMVADLYHLLIGAAEDKIATDIDFFNKVANMDMQFREYSEFFRWDMEHFFHNESNLIPKLKAKVDEVELTFSANQQQIIEKGHQLIELKQQLSEQDKQLAKRDKQLSEKDKQLAKKDEQLAERGKQVTERGKQLVEQNKQLAKKDKQLAERGKQVAERGKQVAEQNKQLAKKDKQISERGKQVVERGKQLAEQNKQLSKKDKQLAERGKQVAERGKQLAERSKQLAKKDEQLAERGKQVAERGKQLAEQNKQLAKKDKQISEHCRQLSEHNRQLIEQGRQLSERDKQLTERDKQLSEQGRKFAERDKRLTEQGRQLSERDKQLSEQGRQLSERDKQLAEKEKQTTDLLANLFKLRETNTDLKGQINELFNSNSWKITKPLRAIRRFFSF